MDPAEMTATPAQPRQVALVRRFNRTLTQRIGVLEDRFLARERPLGQARVLWEIGPGGCEVRALRARLELDSGYLSRLLTTLQRDGLATLDTDPADARVRRARLTPAGLAERAELDRRSDAQAATILGRLTPAQRGRLVRGMAEVERLLVASMVEIAEVDPHHPDARACLRAYYAELAQRFDGGFDPARGLPTGEAELTPPAGVLLVARLHTDAVGCGAVLFHPGGATAHLRRMYVAPGVRGLGLGRRLLAELEQRAAQRGCRTVELETNRALSEAIALYRRAGYREVPPFNRETYAHHWFRKTLPGPPG